MQDTAFALLNQKVVRVTLDVLREGHILVLLQKGSRHNLNIL